MQTIVVVALVLIVLYIVFRIFKTMLKWLLIIVVCVLAIAFFSNPDDEKHRKSLKAVRKELHHKVKEKNVKIDDYKIFSLAKAKVKGEEKIIGIGAFGKVWYFDNLKESGD